MRIEFLHDGDSSVVYARRRVRPEFSAAHGQRAPACADQLGKGGPLRVPTLLNRRGLVKEGIVRGDGAPGGGWPPGRGIGLTQMVQLKCAPRKATAKAKSKPLVPLRGTAATK